MATQTVAAPEVRRNKGRIVFRSIFILLGLVVIGLAILVGRYYHFATSALPQLDGGVNVAGLTAPVNVIRDEHGVPHITASSLADLFFAQGYIVAQDRLWQMDMSRRFAGGEMAEVLGQATGPGPNPKVTGTTLTAFTWVDHDKRQRVLRLRAVAERVAEKLPARDRAFFEAYSRGVNAYMEQHRDQLPLEFHVLNYSPRPWTVSDSIIVGLNMSQLLNPQYEMEYWREQVGAKLSPELMADLYPADSWRDHPPGAATNLGPNPLTPAAGSKSQSGIPAGAGPLRTPSGDFDCESCLPGSNNWVVAGAHTTTGKVLLSNDMHLPHSLPGVWYEVQLHSGDFNVEGFSLPGMPFVIVGHNQRIAWGFTNLNPDVQDLFIENFNDNGLYQTPTGWQRPEVAHEVIHVKGSADVTFNVTITRHGPLVSDLMPWEKRKLALQWVIYDSHAVGIPLFDLDAAQNWEQFRKALSIFATPSQNVVYGDLDGHIGYQAMGYVPLRASGDGTLPVSGADGQHDWNGYLPFDKLPSVFDPPSGIIASANSRITPQGYPYVISTQWFPPYRTERIYHLLGSRPKFSPDDMLALQTDITSEYDRLFAERFVDAIDHNLKASEQARRAAGIMRGFDGRMDADSAAPTIEVGARRALWKLLLEGKLGDEWVNYEWSEQAVALENIIEKQPARWLRSPYNDFNELLTAAVELALAHAPSDLSSWKYGAEYPLEINHPILGMVPLVNRWSGPGRVPQSGGGYTVKQVGRRFGPSERMTIDFSNLDASHFNIVIGESGQFMSPYYMDQWDAWYHNKTFSLAYSDSNLQAGKTHELVLSPGH